MLVTAEPNQTSAASVFLFICLKTLPERELRNEEINCWSSWLPSGLGLGYPWAVFWPGPSFYSSIHSWKIHLAVVLRTAFFCSLSYFCFTLASMPSSPSPSSYYNYISSTCLFLKSCRWFCGAGTWLRAAAGAAVPGCRPELAFQWDISLLWPREAFLPVGREWALGVQDKSTQV